MSERLHRRDGALARSAARSAAPSEVRTEPTAPAVTPVTPSSTVAAPAVEPSKIEAGSGAAEATAAWTQQGGGRTLLMLELGDPENIRCDAHFTESAALMFEVLGDRLHLLGGDVPWRPLAVLDADVDGTLEVLVRPSNGLGGIVYSGFKVADEVRFPSGDDACPEQDDAEP